MKILDQLCEEVRIHLGTKNLDRLCEEMRISLRTYSIPQQYQVIYNSLLSEDIVNTMAC